MSRPSAWTDKFTTPGREDLLALIDPATRELVDLASAALSAEAAESIVWLGVPWRWTMRYGKPKAAGREVYLVPDPAGPLLAAQLDAEMLAAIDLKGRHRSLREGLASATRVGDRVWAQWPMAGRQQTTELVDYLMDFVLTERHRS